MTAEVLIHDTFTEAGTVALSDHTPDVNVTGFSGWQRWAGGTVPEPVHDGAVWGNQSYIANESGYVDGSYTTQIGLVHPYRLTMVSTVVRNVADTTSTTNNEVFLYGGPAAYTGIEVFHRVSITGTLEANDYFVVTLQGGGSSTYPVSVGAEHTIVLDVFSDHYEVTIDGGAPASVAVVLPADAVTLGLFLSNYDNTESNISEVKLENLAAETPPPGPGEGGGGGGSGGGGGGGGSGVAGYPSLFPLQYSYGSVGGPSFKVEIVQTANKEERRNALWTDARHRYDLTLTARTQAQMDDIKDFHAAMGGPEFSFLFWDYADFRLTDELIGVGDGAETVFQTIKTYSAGAASHIRPILKPRAGLVVSVNGVEETGASVDTTTGLITFSSAPANGLDITVTGRFDVPVRFVEDELRWRVVDRTHSDGAEGDYLYVPESLNFIEVIGE